MSNIAQATNTRLPMPQGFGDVSKWRVLTESIFPSAKTPEAIVLALDYCRARNLDVMKRPVNIVPMWNKTLKKNVETVWPGINEVQITASRTGKYAGMDEPKWGEETTRTFKGQVKGYNDDGEWEDTNKEVTLTFPEYCSVTVYRMVEGHRCAFTEPVFWEEAYAHQGKSEIPNYMWTKRPKGQLLKVAKAFSLRAAFPEEGEYTAEEMEGKEIESGGVIIDVTPKNNHNPEMSKHPMPDEATIKLESDAQNAAAGGSGGLVAFLKGLDKDVKAKLLAKHGAALKAAAKKRDEEIADFAGANNEPTNMEQVA